MIPLSDICPVCNMKTEAEIPSVEHHKMYFYFCSEQCRKMFISHPSLYSVNIGKEQNAIIKRRTLPLADVLESEVIELLIPYLKEMMGVIEVVVEGDKLEITYDLLQVTENQIEEALVEVGVQLGDGWLERLRRGWIQGREDVELDNLASPPAPCYNRAPPKI